jgi:hypothetical protein
MKTLNLAVAAVALTLVAGPALAYDQAFINDTPSLLFRTAPVQNDGADLNLAPVYQGNGSAVDQTVKGYRYDSDAIGRTPSREFDNPQH